MKKIWLAVILAAILTAVPANASLREALEKLRAENQHRQSLVVSEHTEELKEQDEYPYQEQDAETFDETVQEGGQIDDTLEQRQANTATVANNIPSVGGGYREAEKRADEYLQHRRFLIAQSERSAGVSPDEADNPFIRESVERMFSGQTEQEIKEQARRQQVKKVVGCLIIIVFFTVCLLWIRKFIKDKPCGATRAEKDLTAVNKKAGDFKTFKEFVHARQQQASDFYDVRYPLGLRQGFSYGFRQCKKDMLSNGGMLLVIPVLAVIGALLAAIYFTIKYYWDRSGGFFDYLAAFLVLFVAMSFKSLFFIFSVAWLHIIPNIYLSEAHYADAKIRYFWARGKKYCDLCVNLYHRVKAVAVIVLLVFASLAFYEAMTDLFTHMHPSVAKSIDFSFGNDDY